MRYSRIPKAPLIAAFSLVVLAGATATAATFSILPDGSDTQLSEDGGTSWPGSATVRVGGGSTLDTVAVYAFELPEIPEGEFILSANFQFYLEGVSNTPGPADLYALPARESNEFTIDDFYHGAFGEDPNATAVQANILLVDSEPGVYTLSMLGQEALTQHIVAQYEDGAQPGDYVVMRLGPKKDNETNYYFYTVGMSNNDDEAKRPLLIIETFDGNYAPTLDPAPLEAVEVGAQLDITVSGSDQNEDDTLSFSSDELPDFVSLVDNEDGTATLTIAPVSGDAGLHIFDVTVSDGAREGSGPVSVVVTDANASGNAPVVEPIDPMTMDHGTDVTIDVAVTDADSDTVSLTAVNLPPFATFMDNGDLSGTLTLDTWYSDPAGEYEIFIVAEDEAANTGVGTFVLTLEAIDFAPGYYVDPINGSMSNDGTPERPWSTLEDVMAVGTRFQPGDVIYLRDGYHGEPTINGSNDDYVYIQPAEGHRPYLSRLGFNGNSQNWNVSGLEISRSFAEEYSKAQMVSLGGTNNILSDCTIYSVPDTSAWTADDWNALSANGVGMGGSHNTLENCTIINVNFAVAMGTETSFQTVRRNHIQNFSGDAVRALGNDQLVEGNFIADNYNVNDNHDDGVQGWSVSDGGGSGTGVTARITIRDNTIIETTDPDRALQGPLQGIGLFDGMFEEWVIENNVIVVNQWHGIAIYGAINCRIVNNTVLDQNMFQTPGPTWITIEPHKNYTNETDLEKKNYYFGTGNIVANNITTDIFKSLDNPYAELKNNIEVNEVQFDDYFVDYPYDVRLRVGSPAIDAGDADEATDVDIVGTERMIGEAPDVGAYEWTGTWHGWEVDEGWVNSGAFFGQMFVDYSPWLYDDDSETWFYIDETSLTDAGVWFYALDLAPFGDGTTDDEHWAGYPLDEGWAMTPIGGIYPTEESWAFVGTFGNWSYVEADGVSDDGAWIYAVNGEPAPD